MKSTKKYTIVSDIYVCEEEPCICYGIQFDKDVIPHISTDRVFVELIMDLVNRLEWEPQRARDLIEHLLP